jgi:glucose/arabinose dehydrogenase
VYEPFIYGWLEDETAWGRPNDVLQTKEGHLLISDDEAGAVYLVSYSQALAAN